MLLFVLQASAQFSEELVAKRVGPGVGLSNNTVRAIHQDQFGFMWFGTADGLNRFDGYEFISFHNDPSDNSSLLSNHVRSIAEDSAGLLWIGTEVGLNSYSPEVDEWRSHLRVRDVAGIAIQNQYVYIAHASGLLRYQSATGTIDTLRVDISSNFLPSVDVCDDGLVYSGDGKLFLSKSDQSELVQVDLAFDVVSSFCPSALDSNRAGIVAGVVANEATYGVLADGSTTQLSPRGGRTAIIDSRGGVWSGGSGGLFLNRTSGVTQLNTRNDRNDQLSNDVWRVYEDDQNGIWVGTLGGLFRFDGAPKLFRTMREDLTTPAVSSIDVGSDATWIGTIGGGLNYFGADGGRKIFRSSRSSVVDPAHQIPGDIIWTMERGSDALWIGTENGLAYLDNDQRAFTTALMPKEALNPSINTIIPDGTGGMMVGGSGLMHIPNRSKEPIWVSEPSGSSLLRNVQSLYSDSSGRLWIGDEFSLLFEVVLDVSESRFRMTSISNVRDKYAGAQFGSAVSVRDMVEHPAGVLWLASEGGLIRFEPDAGTSKVFTSVDGLPGNNVFSLVIHGDQLWMGTNRGLAYVDLRSQEVHRVVDRHGVTAQEFNRRARYLDEDGELHFGGLDGLITFRPEDYLNSKMSQRVAITKVQKTTKRGIENLSSIGAMQNGVVLEPGEQSISFDFAALDYSAFGQHSYTYRLVNNQDDWVDARQQRSIRYSGLTPGEYEFQVSTLTGRTDQIRPNVRVKIVVLPAVWMTWWFRTILGIVLVSAAYSIHRMRIRRALHVERMRNRIAGDLHDDIGSNLSSIAILSDLISSGSNLPEVDAGRLRDIGASAREMVGSLREIVWSIDPSRDQYSDLIEYLHETARALTTGIQLDFSAAGEESASGIGLESRRIIVLMFKEILTNAVRHAGASKIGIAAQATHNRIAIVVTDDGCGFDTAEVHNGFGLRGLRRRADSVGADFSITSSAEGEYRGTRVELVVPY